MVLSGFCVSRLYRTFDAPSPQRPTRGWLQRYSAWNAFVWWAKKVPRLLKMAHPHEALSSACHSYRLSDTRGSHGPRSPLDSHLSESTFRDTSTLVLGAMLIDLATLEHRVLTDSTLLFVVLL